MQSSIFQPIVGYNNNGQLGDSSYTNRNRPTKVKAPDNTRFTDLSLGAYHTCGIIENGSVYCWGYNNRGQLGDNSIDNANIPNYTRIPGNSKQYSHNIGGTSHMCINGQ